jgi:vacuolar-type H+-ATPase subunit E/Vma4
MPLRVIGDPEKIVNQVIEEFRRELEKRIAEALEASRSVLEKAYDEALRSLERSLEEKLRGLEEKLKSAEATREVELRRELAKLRAAKVDEVLGEALSKLPEYVPRSQYEGFIERLLREAKERSGGKAKIVPVERDRELVERLARKLGLEVSGETRSGYGGFIAITSDGVVLDYTLEKVLSDVIDKARAVIARELFGEEA